MSTGRYIFRGYAFQGLAFRPLALAGASVTVTAPNDGWIAQSRTRVAISEQRSRLMIPASRERIWIAEGK